MGRRPRAPTLGPVPDVTVRIEQVAEPTAEHAAALDRLLPQLSASAPLLSLAELGALVAPGRGVRLLAARLEDGSGGDAPLVGFAVLAVFASLTGTRGWLEDVVVDEAARNHGVGTRLVEAVVAAARAAGCRTLDLTSRPSREAANRLYGRCGFVRRETNVWRHDLRA